MIEKKQLDHYLKSFNFNSDLSGVEDFKDNWAGVTIDLTNMPNSVEVTSNVRSTPITCHSISEIHNAVFTQYQIAYKEDSDGNQID